jgi:hypothetical protein
MAAPLSSEIKEVEVEIQGLPQRRNRGRRRSKRNRGRGRGRGSAVTRPARPRGRRPAPKRKQTQAFGMKGSATVSAKMGQVLSANQDLVRFMQATTHPFGPEGVGAVIPDNFDVLSISTYDPLTIALDLALITGSAEGKADGVICAILPRCFASGLYGANEIQKISPGTAADIYPAYWKVQEIGTIFVDSSFTQSSQSYMSDANDSNESPNFANAIDFFGADPYVLMIIPVGVDGYSQCFINTTAGIASTRGVYLMRFPRCQKLIEGTTGFRIVGAGVKINPRASLLETDGQAFAAQVKIDTFIKMLTLNHTALAVKGPFENFQNKFIGSYTTNKGLQGATSRYNIFQNNDQLNQQETSIEEGINEWAYHYDDLPAPNEKQIKKLNLDKIPPPTSINRCPKAIWPRKPSYKKCKGSMFIDSKINSLEDFIEEKVEIDIDKRICKLGGPADGLLNLWTNKNTLGLSKNDLCDPSTSIPVVYYQFNDSTPILLELWAVVHGQARPNPEIPFLSQQVNADPLFPVIKTALANPAIFPLTSKGNSFRSALTKFNNIAAHVLKFASKGAKILKMLEQHF